MNDICTLLSLANGPKLNYDKNDCLPYTSVQNHYNFNYKKTSNFDGLQIEYKLKTMFLLKLKNINSTSVEVILNVKNPEIEIKEIIHLFEKYHKVHHSLNRPSDG